MAGHIGSVKTAVGSYSFAPSGHLVRAVQKNNDVSPVNRIGIAIRAAIFICGAKDHAAMRRAGIVHVSKVLAVVRQHGSSAGMSECQYVLVSHTRTSQAGLRYNQHVAAELP
jgi:hypothetical protein